ncbi:MAG TPA: PaaI family thioesterase [Gammaproteobacteria bacterium]|jgi:acyl-coenzyme A thioesterase PaaI-like protein|nr:thioesterase [Gammaproteobacteria bacterium]MBQ08394.1 thioesterase [Gammaproteobacteria bacterium]HJL80722.1 PaaI family thioesterase [Gammaproteobacteria bacterium]HJM09630.1 PaaI family thioesterase [Gammaproteobacteria bacterium]HJN01101.1 PaaI family thioesterase [Gammaproteobacteria bacterium]|tara:strand:+ start:18154 stop:18561 length:408 start_codon:yes stop_codon:yes gene_type:complete
MSEIDFSDNNCFVCGPNNSSGLKITFSINDDDVCMAEFTPEDHHVGFQNTTHGGIIFSLLDDVMANWLFLKDLPAQTAKCDLRYKNSLQTGETVLLEGHHLKTKSRMAMMYGLMKTKKEEKVIAECHAKFMIMPR